ncbi:hypothetical protein C9374_014400 [Naegleria lovaniensis]|uniref:SAM domain-containing protein n=1 Tax=Naegleria lovaniensis TaxID=51637 RepID=A0AA88GUA1_NAELO|nr:uncharacterized protein C9374_014400 [Naegleria lovaniensis]KAG2389000.1 hypothetical protein C9374_014400 [Naegleria lovaniensis]
MSQNDAVDNIPLSEWDTSVVLQFLTNQKITDKKVHEILKTHQINGALLGQMTLDDLKRFNVPVGFANSIVKKVAALKEFQAKYLGTHFREMEDLITDIHPTQDFITNESMNSVSIPSTVSVTDHLGFLPCAAWDESQFSSEQKKAFDFCKQKLDFIPEATSVNSKYRATICQNLTFPDRFKYEYLNPQRLENYKTRTTPGTPNDSIMKVRLVITELSEATQHRFIRKFGSMFGLTGGTTYGMFHTALIVGPWYLEWGDKSLAIVRNRSSAKAVFVAPIGTIQGTQRVNQKIEALAKLCAEWNGTKTYDRKDCNCQHFTEAAIDALNMSIEFNHNIDAKTNKFLKKMKQLGSGERVYKVDKELKKVLLDSNVITTDNDTLQLIQTMRKKIESNSTFCFKTHKELDEFVKFAITVHPLFTSSQDYVFLRGLDRGFWLKYQSAKKSENIQKDDERLTNCEPLMATSSDHCLCPFNPTQEPIDNVNMTVVGQDFVLDAQLGWQPPSFDPTKLY